MHKLAKHPAELPDKHDLNGYGTWRYAGDLVTLDKSCARLLQLSTSERLEAFATRFGPRGSRVLSHELKAVAANEQARNNRSWSFSISHPLAGVRWVKIIAKADIDKNGERCVSGACMDVTAEHVAIEKLGKNHELYRATLSAISDCVILFSNSGAIQYVNAATEELFQRTREELEAANMANLFDMRDTYPRQSGKNFVFDLYASLKRGVSGALDQDAEMVLLDGTVVPISGSISVLKGRSVNVDGVVLIFRDATSDRNIAKQLFVQATTDSLTRLTNRREFERILSAEIEALGKPTTALAFIDLDHFKVINDSRGHAFGDGLLQEIARKLEDWCGPEDIVARIAGDEFAVLIRRATKKSLEIGVKKFTASIALHNRNLHSDDVALSAGVVYLADTEPSVKAAMMAADIACYQAKNAGRGHVVTWDPESSGQSSILGEDLKWASRLSKGLEDGATEVYFQRIEPLSNDVAISELLVRFRGEDGRLFRPKDFIHAAERYGVSWKLDIWMLKVALRLIASKNSASNCERISVNISPASILNGDFRRTIVKELDEHRELRRISENVILEITENFNVRDVAIISEFVRTVQELGVAVAIDDYGSGATSLKYLEVVKASILKIDGNVIRSAVSDGPRKDYLRAIVGLARAMRMQTVAEFVDSPETLALVKELSIDYAQGFYFHEPEPLQLRGLE